MRQQTEKQQWQAIIDRINACSGHKKFKYDSEQGIIYQLSQDRTAYLFLCKTDKTDKKQFINKNLKRK